MQKQVICNGFAMSQEFKDLLDSNKSKKYNPQNVRKFLKMSNEKGFIVVSDNKTGYSKSEYFNGGKRV